MGSGIITSMNERDFRVEILQGYVNIQRTVRDGEPTKYSLLLVSVLICAFGIAPHARSGLKLVADAALAISGAIVIGLFIAATPIRTTPSTEPPTYEQLAAELRAEDRRAKLRHRFLQGAAVLFLIGLITAMVGVSIR